MKKRQILIILFFCSLLALIYLIFTSNIARKNKQPDLTLNTITTAQLEEKYQTQVKKIFNDYENLINNGDYTLDQIIQIKNKLLNLRVLAKFKELHINLVLALTHMENWLNNKDELEKIAERQIIDQIKIDYSWLNK